MIKQIETLDNERNEALKGVKMKSLDEISLKKGEYGGGFSAVEYTLSNPRYIRITDIDENGSLNLKKVSPSGKPEDWEKYKLKHGDILFARSGATVGKTFIYDEKYGDCVYAGYLIRFSPDQEKAFPKYVYYSTKTPLYNAWVAKKQNVVAQPNINAKQYGQELKIPLPPLEQQKKIAAILDAADAYRQKTKALIAKHDELTQSLFLDMFGDPVTNPKGWEKKTIEEITKKEKGSIKRGPFGGALKKEIFVDDGYLVYEQYHALNNDFSFARYYIDDAKFQELKGFEVKSGDIIISCSGVYLGKLAIVPEGAKPGIINQALLKVTLEQSEMTNHFFTFHFRQKNFRETFFDSNRGAGIPNFPPMSSFKKFPFIVPPIEEQQKFEQRVQAIETQKSQAQASLEKAEELFNSLLQRAFKGELTN